MECIFRKEDDSICGSRFNLREVEFRHPDYEQLSTRVFICENHFSIIFGKPILTVDHNLPIEEECYLKQMWINQKAKYKKDLDELIQKVRVGVGLEFFNLESWKFIHYLRVSSAYEKWDILKRKTCRFEWCKKSITNMRNPYIIRVYPGGPRNYVNLFFCSLDHWEVFKKRLGLKLLKGSLDPKKVAAKGLEDFIDP